VARINDIIMAQAVQEAVRPKFRGNTTLKSKVALHYPDNLSREYVRITNAYMSLMYKSLKEYLPQIKKAIDDERAGMRQDDASGVMSLISQAFLDIQESFTRKTLTFGLKRRLDNLANLTRKLTIREWKRVVQKTLGINILEDYYKGGFYRDALEQWTQRNVDLITSVPQTTIPNMQTIIEEGYRAGKTNTAIGRELQEAYGIEKRKAQFWARDQMSKLNADITQEQQRDAGVEEYVWSDSGDGRVRKCHAYLQGKQFKWSDPPEMWYMTKKRGRVYTGRRCHPGQDYRCRCVSLPVFNLPTLNLPWEGKEEKQ